MKQTEDLIADWLCDRTWHDREPCSSHRKTAATIAPKLEAYVRGVYETGEDGHAADWALALDGVLPEGVEPYPSQVTKYIQSLQAQLLGFVS